MNFEDELDALKSPPQQGGGSLFLFLGLFLLVLAFFIVLVAISNLEQSKVARVIRNLNSTFSSPVLTSRNPENVVSKSGRMLGAEKHHEKIKALFKTEIRAAKVKVIQPGRSMLVRLPRDTLFIPNQETVRESRKPLLRRIALSLAQSPEGVRYDIEMIIGSDYLGELSLPVTETLTTRRLGAVARELLALGAPPDSLAIGTQRANPEEVNIWFFSRERQQTRSSSDGSLTAE